MENYNEVVSKLYPLELNNLVQFLQETIANNLVFSNAYNDGRVNSVKDEASVIKLLKDEYGDDIIEPPPRTWFDVAYKSPNVTYYINIKCSTGKTDNAFCKKAVIYSLCDIEPENVKGNINYNTLMTIIAESMKTSRDVRKEYFYLYIDKNDGNVFLKSILDIQNFVSNPINILQINWKKEKKDMAMFNDSNISEAKKRLLSVVSRSLKSYFKNCSLFLEFEDE
jgi:hypothetical protein